MVYDAMATTVAGADSMALLHPMGLSPSPRVGVQILVSGFGSPGPSIIIVFSLGTSTRQRDGYAGWHVLRPQCDLAPGPVLR